MNFIEFFIEKLGDEKKSFFIRAISCAYFVCVCVLGFHVRHLSPNNFMRKKIVPMSCPCSRVCANT